MFRRIRQKMGLCRLCGGRSRGLGSEAHPPADNEPTAAVPESPDKSPTPEPPPIDGQAAPARLPIDLWDLAYKDLREEDEMLVVEYEGKLCGDLIAGVGSTLGSTVGMRDRMRVVLDQKMQEVNRDIWKLKFHSTEVQVRDLVEPALGAINWANDYIGNAVSANPYASIAWVGVSLLLPLLLNPSEQRTSLAKGLEYISSLIVRTRLWEELYDRRYESGSSQDNSFLTFHTAYRDSLKTLYRHILKFQITSYCYYANNTASRLGQDVSKLNEWDMLLDGIKDKEREFAEVSNGWKDIKYEDECAAADKRHQEATRHWESIKIDISELRRAVQDAQKERERKELLDWLCKADPSGIYNAALEKHQPGTCEWLVRDSNEFKTWQESSSSLLWLHGKAGSGKSILSSSVIKYLQERYDADPGCAFAYFFFSFSDREKQDLAVILASLVKQVSASQPFIPQAVKALGQYKEKGLRPNIKTLENALMTAASGFSSVSIVLDALDECPTLSGERGNLLRSLTHIIDTMPHNFHIFCTSRAEPDIKEAIGAILPRPSRAAIDLATSRTGTNQDINLYIDSMFASIHYNSWPDDLKARAKNLLSEKADGMFQYIYCQFEVLRKYHSISEIKKALQQLPNGLDATYDTLLQNLDTDHQTRILSLLKWLAVSKGNPSLEELAETFIISTDAISVDEEKRLLEPKLCLELLSSLVTTPCGLLGGTTVRLAHFSLKEYLMSENIAKGPAARFYFSERDAHLHVALSCLAYHLHRSSLKEKDVKGLRLMYYAADNWMWHLEMAKEQQWPQEIVDYAARALTPRSNSLKIMSDRSLAINWHSLRPSICGSLGREKSNILQRPLYLTARLGYLKLTEMLLRGDPGIKRYATQWDFDVALHEAAYGGKIEAVRFYLDGSARPKEKSDGLGNALVAAACRGHADIVNLLLKYGADIDAKHRELGSPLQAAAFGDCLDVVRLLINRGANVKLPPNEAGSVVTSAMPDRHWIISTKILQCLLDSGADINAQGGTKGTALHEAAVYLGRTKAHFHLLLERGADVNAQGGKYGYPLQAVCTTYPKNNWAEVNLLLNKGADVNAQGGYYGNALQAACYACRRGGYGDQSQVVRLLLDKGADINAQGGKFGTALQAACNGSTAYHRAHQ
ncbi:hypothetical protein F5Y10DRAFT_246133 [Nemania abortiva]|nr:hypothetical protein F5Y10DRAFT_246133 [Nemania abortiva]